VTSKPVAWSYSALDAFETCPWRYYLTKVTKEVSEPQTDATMWGNRVHKALENYLMKRQPLGPELEKFQAVADTVVARAAGGKLEAEKKMALTSAFQPTTWFGKDVWVRGITDFTIHKGDKMFIGDWKTGRPTPGSAQLKLTAAMTFAHRPYINTIINAFVWLKTGSTTAETFTRADIPTIWQEFAPRVRRLEVAVEETKFPKRPSGLCREWCPVHTCEHNGKYTGPRS
jgi:hypothetical protein